MTSRRETCLNTALRYVTKDRANAYGTPEDNFGNIAAIWNEQGYRRFDQYGEPCKITATDVALMMVGMKLARLKFNPTHDDSWIDIAGYAACGMDTAGATKPEVEHIYTGEREHPIGNVVAKEGTKGGWVRDMYRCAPDNDGSATDTGSIGNKPHAAHSYGHANGMWCDGYI